MPAKDERWYEVYWSEWHHGQYSPERPWCAILRSKPGVPGEPSDGIRYMTSYATREEAIREVAKRRAAASRRYQSALARAGRVFEEVLVTTTEIVTKEADALVVGRA